MSCKHDTNFSCPCLKGLLWLTGIFLITGILLLVFLSYDHNARWIEWMQLFVDIAGAIAIPIVIWWLSNNRRRRIEENDRRIMVINQVLSDFLIFSRQLKNYIHTIKQAKQGCSNAIKKLKIAHIDNSFYEDMKKTFYVFTAIRSLNYNSTDLSFISLKNKELYFNLLILKAKELDLDDDIAFRNRKIECLNIEYNKDNNFIGKIMPIEGLENIIKSLNRYNILSLTTLERTILLFQSVFKDLQKFIEKDISIPIDNILNDKYLKEVLEYKFEQINPNEES